MDGIDTSGKALVDFWGQVVEKGQMKSNSANALKVACAQVLAENPGWETMDMRGVDPDDLFRRFQNKRHKDFKIGTLNAYRRRFIQGHKEFLSYATNPRAWKPSVSERVAKRDHRDKANGHTNHQGDSHLTASSEPAPVSGALPVGGALVEFPFPLRHNRLAYFRLPTDLKMAEVRRLSAYLETLAVDAEEVQQPTA